MYFRHDDNRILLIFLALSLLLHLSILLLMPEVKLIPEIAPGKPVYVEVRTPTQPRELDLPTTKDQARETPAKRKGPSDQVVKNEQAPKGDSIEDRAPAIPETTQPQPADELSPEGTGKKTSKTPDLAKLMALPATTVNRIDDELRTKYRDEVVEGESIWLDTEQDILISFYQRLRRGIYNVWNYPSKSKERGETGTCLIRMTFNRDGTIKENGVELLETSGYPRLDREAVAAVYKGAPYGKLPKTYEKEELSILAFFRYTMNETYISN